MAIEESKISDLIAIYKGYEEKYRHSVTWPDLYRASIYQSVIEDLESLFPRKTLADLDVAHFSDLTGAIVEHAGMKGVLLGGSGDVVTLFTFADTCAVYADPSLVYPLDEDRIWDETGRIL